jgi:hypothetical protein
MLRLIPSIHLSLGLPLLRVPSGYHSKVFSGSLFPGILSTCPNHRSRFSSVTSKMFFPTFMIALMVPFRAFSFLHFLADKFINRTRKDIFSRIQLIFSGTVLQAKGSVK